MSNITEAEEMFCMYKLQMLGGGMTSLIQTIFHLDDVNRAKIALGFPELVEVINRYGSERGYWKDLTERWNAQGWAKIS